MKCKNRAESRDLTKPHRDRQKAVPVPTDATLRLLSLEPCKYSQPLHSLSLSLHFHQNTLSLLFPAYLILQCSLNPTSSLSPRTPPALSSPANSPPLPQP